MQLGAFPGPKSLNPSGSQAQAFFWHPGYFLGPSPLSFSVLLPLLPTQHHLWSKEKPQCGCAGYCRHQFSTSLFVASTFLAPAYSSGRTWVTLIQARKHRAKLNWDTENVWQDNNEVDVHRLHVCRNIPQDANWAPTELVTRWGQIKSHELLGGTTQL